MGSPVGGVPTSTVELAGRPALRKDHLTREQEESGMHAVIVDVSINNMEEAERDLRERVVPRVSQSPGFVSGVWIENGEGKGHSVALFETEEAANAVAGQVRASARPNVTIEDVRVHEVMAHA
jgi:hypothetical protein